MRISDWSSDVCSSDLPAPWPRTLLSAFSAIPWRQETPAAGQLCAALHAAGARRGARRAGAGAAGDRHRAQRSHRQPVAVRSEEHTSELQSLMRISYAVFCLKKKTPTLLELLSHSHE